MDKEKFDSVLNYFDSMGIVLPTEVKNSIEDVFLENDNLETVECYHREELDAFQHDTKPINIVNINLDGSSSGEVTNVWTYYGDIKMFLKEEIRLVRKDSSVEEDISIIENPNDSIVGNIDDYVVLLRELVTWDTTTSSNTTRKVNLLIYCPKSDDPEEIEVNIQYNKLKEEMQTKDTITVRKENAKV